MEEVGYGEQQNKKYSRTWRNQEEEVEKEEKNMG